MPRTIESLQAFNRGLISPLALARTDIDRTALSAETMTNWMPRNLGSMMLRPGSEYIGATLSNSAAKFIPFVFSTDDTALLEITGTVLRVWTSDSLISRASVSSTVANTDFTTDVASWTDDDDAGGTSGWEAHGGGGGVMYLTGDGTNAARRYQEVTVAAGDQSVEHALEIVVDRGPVTFRVGSSQGDDDYINETALDEGTHSLSFTPTGNFFVEFESRLKRKIRVDSCGVAASGVMQVTAPWAGADIGKIRYDQSGDIVYVACAGYQQYKIERRSSTSWSVVKYYAEDGPFRTINLGPTTITSSAISGNVTLTASAPLFKSTHVGALFRMTSSGQTVQSDISSENTFTNAIRVTGVDASRIFTIIRAGTWSATVTLQRSLTSSTGPWEDVTTYTTNATITYDDTLDNQIAWYRIGVKTGDFDTATITNATQANPCQITAAGHPFSTGETVTITGVVGMTELNGNTYTITYVDANNFTLDSTDSTGYTAYSSGGTATSAGPVDLTLDYALGSVDGVARIVTYTNATTVLAEVITDLGNTDATEDWYEGEWSSFRGFPTAVAIAEGRLVWAGKEKVWLSASDNYVSYNDLFEGDSETIARTIGSGPVDNINWILPVRKLLIGADGAEFSMRSSSEDEPLTPTNAHIKSFSTQGSGEVEAVKLDSSGIFVQRGGSRVMEMSFGESYDYVTQDLTTFYPEAGNSQITRIAVQRQPDTRIHCVRTDGDVSILLHDKAENISCWVTYSSAGSVEDVVVLPGADGDGEDAVYYVVNRTINGSTVRYLEKWALESQCRGETVNRQLDSFETYTSAGSTVTGLDHLEGETVTAWGGGANKGTATVSSGSATFSSALGDACVGLSYTAQYKSSKLAYSSGVGTGLAQKKAITTLGVILKDTHYQGLEYGPDFTNMDNLPLMSKGAEIPADTVHSTFDEESFSFPGEWDTDSRLCLQATSPNPVTVLAAIIGLEVHGRY